MQEGKILINILTRTSDRPLGFYNCYKSIEKQSYKNIKQFVSYEKESDIVNFDLDNVCFIKVNKILKEYKINSEGNLHAPYNLYCNMLLNQVTDGWVMYLDDDDHLFHNNVINEIVAEINKADEETLFIWQMRYPDGKTLPSYKHFRKKEIVFEGIGCPCFIFHSKYKKFVQWDEWKASDFRVVKNLYDIIPNKKWIEKTYIQINNYGDFGNGNDLKKEFISNFLFNKKWYWSLIPKKHFNIKGVYVFQFFTYRYFVYKQYNYLKKRFKL